MDNENTYLSSTQEDERKKKMHTRLLWLFVALNLIVLGYIIYQLIFIFN